MSLDLMVEGLSSRYRGDDIMRHRLKCVDIHVDIRVKDKQSKFDQHFDVQFWFCLSCTIYHLIHTSQHTRKSSLSTALAEIDLLKRRVREWKAERNRLETCLSCQKSLYQLKKILNELQQWSTLILHLDKFFIGIAG